MVNFAEGINESIVKFDLSEGSYQIDIETDEHFLES